MNKKIIEKIFELAKEQILLERLKENERNKI